LKIFDFSSEKKLMTAIIDVGDNICIVHTKGAVERLLSRCSHIVKLDGSLTQLDDLIREGILTKVRTNWERLGYRAMGFAYKKLDEHPGKNELEISESFERNLIYLGAAGIQDPLREEIPHALQQCGRAGVTVRMITGDSLETAISIAKSSGILPETIGYDPNSLIAMEGKSFQEFVNAVVFP
jgi:magnesium-transporting ATPase (P-type)